MVLFRFYGRKRKWICARNRSQGFSLIELIVTLSITVILITIAIPAFMRWINQNELSGTALLFRHLMSDARSEAVKRGEPVRLCNRQSDVLACKGTSLLGSKDWSHGAMLFLDANANRSYEADFDQLIRVVDFPQTVATRWNRGDSLSFLPTGRMNWGSNGTFILTSHDTSLTPIHLVVGIQGRIRSYEP